MGYFLFLADLPYFYYLVLPINSGIKETTLTP